MPPDSVIHDIGYQRYTGVRLGRGYVTRSLYVHGVRTVFGLGRSAKAKIFPWAMIGIMVLVAVIDIAVRALNGKMPISYLGYCDALTLPCVLFIAATAPELVSRDLRNGILPLYFSRPISRGDYARAKLAAVVTGAWLLYSGPLTLIFVAGVFTVDSWHARWHEFTDLLGGYGLAAIYAVVFGALGLLMASWLRRRMVAAAVIVGFFLFTSAVGAVIGQLIGAPNGKAIGQMIGPFTLVIGLKEWIYRVHGTDIRELGPVFLVVTVVLIGAAVGLLHLRYRKVSA